MIRGYLVRMSDPGGGRAWRTAGPAASAAELFSRSGPWLWVAAALVTVLSGLDELSGPPLVWWFVLWRVSRGGHVAWVLACTFSTFVALLGGLAFLTPAAADGIGLVALLHAGVLAVLLGRPVRRRVGRAPVLAASTRVPSAGQVDDLVPQHR